MADWIKLGIVIGVFVLAIALLVPTLIGVGTTDATHTVQLADNESTGITDILAVRAANVSQTGDNATIHYTNNRTLATNSTFVNASQNGSVLLSGSTINVSLSTVDSDGAIITTTYSPTFGWDDGPQVFWEEIGLLIALIAAATIIGFIITMGRAV